MKFTYLGKTFDIEGRSEDDHIYRIIASRRKFYEADLLRYMLAFSKPLKSGVVAIDVGANIGNHSIFFRTFLADRLIAIEPNPDVLPVLERNLGVNIDNYTIFRCGAGDVAGTARITHVEVSKNIGAASLSDDGDGAQVMVRTLDSVYREWASANGQARAIALIKIDVEGMELAVLKGASEVIGTFRPDIYVEAATEAAFNLLDGYLAERGYVSLSHWASTPVYHFAHGPSVGKRLKASVLKHRYQFKKWLRRSLKNLKG